MLAGLAGGSDSRFEFSNSALALQLSSNRPKQQGSGPSSPASLQRILRPSLHATAGFRVIGARECVGHHHGRWHDAILIEHRSAFVMT